MIVMRAALVCGFLGAIAGALGGMFADSPTSIDPDEQGRWQATVIPGLFVKQREIADEPVQLSFGRTWSGGLVGGYAGVVAGIGAVTGALAALVGGWLGGARGRVAAVALVAALGGVAAGAFAGGLLFHEERGITSIGLSGNLSSRSNVWPPDNQVLVVGAIVGGIVGTLAGRGAVASTNSKSNEKRA
jgi:MFS family permease